MDRRERDIPERPLVTHTDMTQQFYFSPMIMELPPGSSWTGACEKPAARIQPMRSDPVNPKPPAVQRSMFSERAGPTYLSAALEAD